MLWIIFGILFVMYVISSLSKIKYQLKLITKHLDIKEKEIVKLSSDEEIEKEFDDGFKK